MFRYLDYRTFLADFYAAKKKRGFSFRAFSRAAGLGAPNYLKLVISGERNLLALGVDVYAVDWGSPTRGDRWLTFEDYVDIYLNDCVEHICREHGVPAINLLGICEGGLFSLCYSALYPKRVKNLVLTITQILRAHGLAFTTPADKTRLEMYLRAEIDDLVTDRR